jgi:hypothetical protein
MLSLLSTLWILAVLLLAARHDAHRPLRVPRSYRPRRA